MNSDPNRKPKARRKTNKRHSAFILFPKVNLLVEAIARGFHRRDGQSGLVHPFSKMSDARAAKAVREYADQIIKQLGMRN